MGSRTDIAIVTATFPPYRGGMGRVAQLDATQLAAAGFAVTVFAPGASDRVDAAGYAVRAVRAWFRYGNAVLAPSLRRVTREHALTVLHYPFFGGAEPTALAKRTRDGKLAIVYHMDVVGRGWLAAVFALHRRFVMPRVLARADRIIVTSLDYARSSAIANIVRAHPERVVEVPPSVDTERFAPGLADAALAARYGLGDAAGVVPPTVFFTGGLDRAHYFKGLEHLLRAAAAPELAVPPTGPSVRFAIIGSGDLRPRYEALADELGISERVRFLGNVPDADLPGLLRHAAVFAFPSVDRSEAFGIAALEALACGVPVVASDLPGVRTIVRHGETGFLVPPGDARALATRLAESIAVPETRARFSAAARAMAVQEYAHDVRAQKLVAALKPLL